MVMQAIAPAKTEQSTLKMSYDAYLDWADEDTHAEWVDGEVIVFMPVKNVHQLVVGFLHHLLKTFVDLFELGQVMAAPVGMRLAYSMRKPDVLFVAKEHEDRLTDDWMEGPADLVIEVVSDDSMRRDRDEKFREYREAGIPEYWIIDPRPGKLRADFFSLQDGEYTLFATEDDEWVDSAVVKGFGLRPSWLWQAKELNPLVCALEIKGVAAVIQKQLEKVTE
ncbi:MAG: Uma2 family endonuclease [Chloroflexi bacterium]|nr:Uma2 family endonuclease [Chloroflexota bacterium]